MPSGTATTYKKTSKTSTSKTKSKVASKIKASTPKPKPKSGISTTKLTKKDEEIIKKRLKKLLQKEGTTGSTSKPSTSKSTSGCSTGSCFNTNANKKFVLSSSKSPSCSSGQCYFTKKDNNAKNKTSSVKSKTINTKKKTATKPKPSTSKTNQNKPKTSSSKTTTNKPKTSTSKTTAKKKTISSTSTQYSCSNGKCTIKPKPSVSKPKGELKCTSGGCFFLKASTKATAKTNSTKTVAKRKAPEIKPKTVPAKKCKPSNTKTVSTKKCKTNIKAKPSTSKLKGSVLKKTCSITNHRKVPLKKPVKPCNPCSPCTFSDSEDDEYTEDDDDFSFSEDESDYYDSDEDSEDDEEGQGGNGPAKGWFSRKNHDSYDSDSWETDSGDSFVSREGGCPFVKKRDNLQTADDNLQINDEDDCKTVEKNTESALVRVTSTIDQERFDSDDSDDTDYEEEDMSYEDSEYSPSEYSPNEYSFNESSNDDDYKLPDSEAEDIYIQKGEARTYPIGSEEDIYFDSDVSSLQLIEIPLSIISKQNVSNFQKKDVESDDSCPQLVPIIQDTGIEPRCEINELFHFSYSESERIEESPAMIAHIFKAVKENSKSKCLSTSLSPTEKNNPNFLDNIINLSPLDKIASKSQIIDTSNYKIVTVPKESTFNEEMMSFESITESQEDLIKEPCKMKAHVFKVDKGKENHQSQLQMSNKNFEKYGNENVHETVIDLSPLERITNVSASCDTTKYEVITSRRNLNECMTSAMEHEKSERKTPEFFSKFYNAIDSRHVLLLLKDTFYIYGTLKLKLIAGGVDIFGFNPEINEVCDIFSPRGYSFLYMKPTKGEKLNKSTIHRELGLLTNDFMKSDLVEILELFDESCDAIILLERNDDNNQVGNVKKYMKENLFPNMNCITLERPFYASEFILRCLLYMKSKNALNINPHWASININKTSKVLVVGGKSVGKSTLIRYLINRNLRSFKKFLLIDLDIGQPEVFVPQTVSATLIEKPLLGPAYFYNLNPERSYLYGDINVVLSPISYLRKVKELIEWCSKEERFKNIPWIINTMGYNKGFGNELISAIAQLLEPSDIIQIQSSREINNFDFILTAEAIKTIPRNIFSEELSNEAYMPKHQLVLFEAEIMKRSRSGDWDMAAKDMRLANVISRLGGILTGRSEWLSDVKPVCARFEDLDIISFSDDNIEKDNLLDVINANLVYLCEISENSIVCHGIGIVRGVDRYQKKIYLLPSISLSTLRNVNCLAVCNIPLPTSVILNQGPKIKDIAPYTYNTNDFIASKHINQIYYRPQQFLRGAHRTVL